MVQKLTPRGRLFLSRPLFAVVATKNKAGSILQFFMWYMLIEDKVNGDTILINTTKKRPQYHNVLNDPFVSLCIGERYQYIRLEGTCKIVDDRDTALQDILRLAARYDDAEAAQWYHDTKCVNEERVSLYVPVTKVYEYWGVDNRKVVGNGEIVVSIDGNDQF